MCADRRSHDVVVGSPRNLRRARVGLHHASPMPTIVVVPMQIPKPTEADKQRFRSLVPDDPRVAVKPMFGNLGAFVNDNMFMGLFGTDIGVKLSQDDQARLRRAGGGEFGPAERPMAGYVSLPATLAAAKTKLWVSASLDFVGQLPPKRKPAKKK